MTESELKDFNDKIKLQKSEIEKGYDHVKEKIKALKTIVIPGNIYHVNRKLNLARVTSHPGTGHVTGPNCPRKPRQDFHKPSKAWGRFNHWFPDMSW